MKLLIKEAITNKDIHRRITKVQRKCMKFKKINYDISIDERFSKISVEYSAFILRLPSLIELYFWIELVGNNIKNEYFDQRKLGIKRVETSIPYEYRRFCLDNWFQKNVHKKIIYLRNFSTGLPTVNKIYFQCNMEKMWSAAKKPMLIQVTRFKRHNSEIQDVTFEPMIFPLF